MSGRGRSERAAPTLIIGSGFAGRAVASRLRPDGYLIVDRGEDRPHHEMRARYLARRSKDSPPWVNSRFAYMSDLPWNTWHQASRRCKSEWELIAGGASNRWDGFCSKLSTATLDGQFASHRWPISAAMLRPYYATAARILNVSSATAGDGGIKGQGYYRERLKKHFRNVELISQAKNTSQSPSTLQGACQGAGMCQICPFDAKARPATIFPNQNILCGVIVDRLLFKGNRAVGVEGRSRQGPVHIRCEQLVIASNGLESPLLLLRSDLPSRVRRHSIGRFYQDHALCQVVAKLDGPIAYCNANMDTDLEIHDLGGTIDGIEYQVVMEITRPPDPALILAMRPELHFSNQQSFFKDINSTVLFNISFEIPPDAGLFLRPDSLVRPIIDDETYPKLAASYARIVNKIEHGLRSRGVVPVGTWRTYESGYAAHHLMGTLHMGDSPIAVTGADFRVHGTDNVFVAGSAVFPRCGAAAPTLTIAALGLMLGDQLAS